MEMTVGLQTLMHNLMHQKALAHMAFVLFRQNGHKFVPPQHFYNTQISMRAKFNPIARSQAKGYEYDYWDQDSDDRLENIFGCLRGLLNGPNVTAAGFEERASILMQLANIYTEYPEWQKDGRRISGVFFDHVNPFHILGAARDYLKVSVRGVYLPTCWQNVRAVAVYVLTKSDKLSDPSVFTGHHVDFDKIDLTNLNPCLHGAQFMQTCLNHGVSGQVFS
jgi:hypothetical protein